MLEVVFERPRLPDDCTFIFTDSTRETFGYNPATRQALSKRDVCSVAVCRFPRRFLLFVFIFFVVLVVLIHDDRDTPRAV